MCVLRVAEVREVFAQVLSDFKIPYTRVPVEPGLHSCTALPAHLQRFYAQVEKDALDSIPVFTRYGIRSGRSVCVWTVNTVKCMNECKFSGLKQAVTFEAEK